MIRFLLQAVAAACGFWIASRMLPGVHAEGPASLLAAGLILGVLNALVRPVLILLTLPFTILTFGLFLLVVNGVTVWLATVFLHGVRIDGPGSAILTAVVISLVSWLAGAFLGPRRRR